MKSPVIQFGRLMTPNVLTSRFRPCTKMSWLALTAALTIGMVTEAARGDYEISTFSNVNPGEVVTITANGQQETGWAGFYNFVNGSGKINGSYSSFCIEIAQDIYYNQTVNFGVASLQNAPIPSNAMGTYRANLIRELWYNDFASAGLNNSNAAAFQIAIWEIENEASGNLLNVSSGTFTVSGNASTIQTANNWLAGLDLSGNGHMTTNLIAFTSNQYQDYVVQVPAPAPPSWILGILGAVGILLPGVFRRRLAASALPAVR